MREVVGHYRMQSPGSAVSSSSAQRRDPSPLLRRPPPPTIGSGRLRSGSSQPSAAPAMLLIRPVQLSRSSALMAVKELPPDRVVRTAVLQLANPTREPFFRAGENQTPPLADAFFPSDEGLQGEWGRQSGGRGEAKGLSWLQWLLANLLILLVAATVVLAIFGQRMFAASGRQAAVATTPGFVLRPDASLRKPPPFVPPRPTHRKAEDAGRKRNVPPKLSGRSTRRRTIHNFKVTRHRKGASSSTELSKSTTDD